MKRFAALYAALDSTTRTGAKTSALVDYFRGARPDDAAWAVFFLTGNRPRQAVRTTNLHRWAAEAANLPVWLFEESYDVVGDLAETIGLVLPPRRSQSDLTLTAWVEERVIPLRERPEDVQRASILEYWSEVDGYERFVFNKLITGAFRVGVSQSLVTRALADVSGIDAKVISHRLAGDWRPAGDNYVRLVSPEAAAFESSKPYPFFLAHSLPALSPALGALRDWQVEWKWDGIRGQLVKRRGVAFLWSRGDELITHQFPEIASAAARLPDCVLDGEILAYDNGRVQPFAALQRRLGRKAPGKKIIDDAPVIYVAYDLLEADGEDWRSRPLHERRHRLDGIVAEASNRLLQLSEIVQAASWEALAAAWEESRARGTEGLMLKRRESPYRVGRVVGEQGGDWLKWKISPLTLDCVLIYAQRGHGKRASLYTDYTFGVWRATDHSSGQRELVPIAKAYSGLSDAEIVEVDAFIRRNTLEKFGPVRTVRANLVVELAFEGIQRSGRHKSGIAVRFPRIARLRRDKTVDQADSIETVHQLLEHGRGAKVIDAELPGVPPAAALGDT